MPKQVGELCHAEALFHMQASEQSLTRLRVCRHVFLDGKRCMRLNQRSQRIRHRPRRSTKPFLVRRKSPTSLWRRSMSSTRKMLDHHQSSKNQGWPPEAVPAVPVASAVPTGRNLRSLQRQRSRHSIERRSLRTAQTKWRPAQPPQSSFTRQACNVLEFSPLKSNSCLWPVADLGANDRDVRLQAQRGPGAGWAECRLLTQTSSWNTCQGV